ncbi:MAG: ASPIC/UnbV domain-containing protein, partial [Opitutus sp.]
MYDSPAIAANNVALRNRGDLQFEDVGAAWGLDQKGISLGAAFGDLDGDGDLDLVYSNYHDGVTVLRNDSDTGHRLIVDLRGTASNRFGIGATVRIEGTFWVQARTLGLSRGYMSSSEPAAHFGLGDATAINRLTVTWPSGHVQTLENVAADQRLTINEPAGSPPANKVSRFASGQFSEISLNLALASRMREDAVNETSGQRLLPFRFNRRGPALAVGRDEVVVGGTTLDAPQVWVTKNGPPFSLAEIKLPPGPVNDGPALLFDADGDG